jgi:hypothetical protein
MPHNGGPQRHALSRRSANVFLARHHTFLSATAARGAVARRGQQGRTLIRFTMRRTRLVRSPAARDGGLGLPLSLLTWQM